MTDPISPMSHDPDDDTALFESEAGLRISSPSDVPQATPKVDLAEHRVPMPNAATPVHGPTEAYPGTHRVKVDYAEHRVPVKSASVPANLADFPDDSEAMLVLEEQIRNETVMISHGQVLPLSGTESVGALLLRARSRLKLTAEQVANQTHIKTEYILALESDDYSKLPPAVYALAYARSLASLYKMPRDLTDRLTALIKEERGGNSELEVPVTETRRIGVHPKKQLLTLAMGSAVAAGILLALILLLMQFSEKATDSAMNPSVVVDNPIAIPSPAASEFPQSVLEGKFKTENFRPLYPQYQHLSLGEVPLPQQ